MKKTAARPDTPPPVSDPAPLTAHRFQSGGIVRDGAFYVHRACEDAMYDALVRGELCYVLAPRQIGKSSLRVRCAQRLTDAGHRCGSVDLMYVGSEGTAEQWYFGLMEAVARALDLEDPLEFWEQHSALAPVHRWTRFVETQVGSDDGRTAVVFIDEIDAVRALAFSGDAFLASIRALHELEQGREQRSVTFCLIGVAAPADLIADPIRAPFNIGRRIDVEDFSRREIDAFRAGLAHLSGEPDAWLDAIYDWTAGHPYMTQKVCEGLVLGPEGRGDDPAKAVERVAHRLFLQRPMEDSNLAEADKRIALEVPDAMPLDKISFYRRVFFSGPVAVRDEGQTAGGNNVHRHSRVRTELVLSGLLKQVRDPAGHRLEARNRVFRTVFGRAWIQAQSEGRELWDGVTGWLASGRTPATTLSGEALQSAVDWSRGRADLTAEEEEFLRAGLELERGRQEALRGAAEASAARRAKAIGQLRIFGLLLILVLAVGVAAYVRLEERARIAREDSRTHRAHAAALERQRKADIKLKELETKAIAEERKHRKSSQLYRSELGQKELELKRFKRAREEAQIEANVWQQRAQEAHRATLRDSTEFEKALADERAAHQKSRNEIAALEALLAGQKGVTLACKNELAHLATALTSSSKEGFKLRAQANEGRNAKASNARLVEQVKQLDEALQQARRAAPSAPPQP